MSIHQFLLIARARRSTLAVVWLGTVAGVVVASLLWPPQYNASASVVLEMKNADPIAGIALPGGLLSTYVATQVDVIQSERVVLRTIRALTLDTNPEWRALWQRETAGKGNYESWLAERLTKKLVVRPSRDSSVLSLGYTAPDPDFAAALVNALVQAYIDTSLELRLEPARRYSQFFDDRAKQLRAALTLTQTRLSKFNQMNGIIASDERLDVEHSRLADLSSQVVELQSDAAGARGRQRQARINPTGLEEARRDPMAASVSAELSEQESRLVDIESRLGEQHPQIAAQRQVVEALRARLTATLQRASETVAVAESVARDRLSEQSALLEWQRARVTTLRAQRDQARVLERDVENAQRAYDSVMTRASQTALQSGDTEANISVLKAATAPASPAWPKLPLNLAIGIVVGLLLGLLAVYFRELSDRRLRSAEDVLLRLRQPLLVVLASTASNRGQGRLQRRVVDGMPQLADGSQ